MPRRRRRASGRKRRRSPAHGPQSGPQRAAHQPKTPVPRNERRLPRLALVWQVYACAGLCSFGSTLGLIVLVRELGYHAAEPSRALLYGGLAACGGLALGLWLPRQFIRRQLHRQQRAARASGPRPAASGQATTSVGTPDPEFAASMAGLLILGLAVGWVLLCGGAIGMESYRHILTRHFVHPGWLTRLLLWAPACLGIGLLSVVGTTALIALQGWHRLVCGSRANVGRLWAFILTTSALAALSAGQTESPLVLSACALLPVFLAGLLCVFRTPLRTASPAGLQALRPVRRSDVFLLPAAGAPAAAVGVALVLALPAGQGPGHTGETLVAILAGSATVGLLVARVLLRWGLGARGAPLACLPVAVALMLPLERLFPAPQSPEPIRLGVVLCCASACVVLVGRRAAQACLNVQYALAWLGTSVVVGFGAALTLTPSCIAWLGGHTVLVLAALGITVVAGLAASLDGRINAPVRVGGLAAIACWLALLPWAGEAPARATPAREAAPPAPESSAAQTVRRLFAAMGLRALRVSPSWTRAAGSAGSAWDADLAGPCADVVIIERSPERMNAASLDIAAGRRLVQRCMGALMPGGRLVVEPPTDSAVEAALAERARQPDGARWPVFRLRVTSSEAGYEALVAGRDAPSWVARLPAPAGMELSLHPWQRAGVADRRASR